MSAADDAVHELRGEVSSLHGVVAALDGHVGRLVEVAEKVYETAAAQAAQAKQLAEVEAKLEQRLTWPVRTAFAWAGAMTALVMGYTVLRVLGKLP